MKTGFTIRDVIIAVSGNDISIYKTKYDAENDLELQYDTGQSMALYDFEGNVLSWRSAQSFEGTYIQIFLPEGFRNESEILSGVLEAYIRKQPGRFGEVTDLSPQGLAKRIIEVNGFTNP